MSRLFQKRFNKQLIKYNYQLTLSRNKTSEHWATVRKTVFPVHLALQHFDSFYNKVYGDSWKSIRLGLLSPNKYCAVVNIYSDFDKIEAQMRQLGAIDLRDYYERHHKRFTRYSLRMKILAEKKAKKIERIAAEKGVDVSEIDPQDVSDVSDVSDRDLGTGFSSMTEAEDFMEMLSANDGSQKDDTFINRASIEIDLTDFVPTSELKYAEDAISDKAYYEFYQTSDEIPINKVIEPKLEIPEMLKVYTFPRGDVQEFPAPKKSNAMGLIDYYLMDCASIIPVFVLGIEKNDFVADYCAAPGGKSLLMALTLRPKRLLANDLSLSRCVRLRSVFKTFIPELDIIKNMVEFSNEDAQLIIRKDYYDKILVDAPCTNDRFSVRDNDNNIFRPSRLTERIKIPENQKNILNAALLSLRVGGSLVYSTCSLSPIQNDGVIHMALKKIWEETNYEYVVCNLKESLRPFKGLFKFSYKFKYGTQIVPFVPTNSGPMYVCKLKRIR